MADNLTDTALYQANFTTPEGGAGDPTVGTSATIRETNGDKLSFAIGSWLSTSALAPHGPVQFSGSAEGEDLRFIWLDAELNSVAVAWTGVTTGTTTITAYKWNPGMPAVYYTAGALNSSTPAIILTITESGYYAFKYQATAITTGVTAIYSAQGPFWGHRAINGVSANIGSIQAFRSMGVAVRYSNRAAFNNMQGKVYQAQLPIRTDWQDYLNNTGSNPVSAVNGGRDFDAKTGSYGFLKPAQASDFDAREDYECNSSGQLTDSFYPLEPWSAVLAVQVSISDVAGRDGELVFTYSNDYQTTDVWRAIAQPPRNWKAYIGAVGDLRDMDQFYENPLHLMEILSGIRSAVKAGAGLVTRFGPTVLRGAQYLQDNL